MKNKKYCFISLFLVISVLLLTSCTNEKTDNNSINLGLMSDTAAIPFIVAQEKGFFEDQGINVNIQVFFSAVDRDAALLAKELDGVSSDIISAGLLKEGDNNVKIISKTESEYKLISSNSSHIISIDNFNDKSVGLSTNTLMEFLVDEIISKYNLSNIEKVNIPKMPTRLEMLRNDQLDGAILPEPLASVAINSDGNLLLSNGDLNLFPGVMIFNEDFLINNQDVLNKFVHAYNESVDYINNNGIEEFNSKLAETLSFPEDVDMSEMKFDHMSLPANSDINEAMNWLFNKSLITEKYTMEDLVYNILS